VAESAVSLRFGTSDTDVTTMQYVIDIVLREIRSRPPLPDARGHAILDLSTLTGLPPIDLHDVAPGCGLADLDLTRVQIAVRPDGLNPDASGCALVVFIGAPPLTGSAEVALRAQALRAFFTHVLLPQLRHWAGRDVVGQLRPDDAFCPPPPSTALRPVRLPDDRALT
jgi:hypothetical protein